VTPPKPAKLPNNYVAEWFGHRVYPTVAETAESVTDQLGQRCPFLSRVKDSTQQCIKPPAARGVCTVSSNSNGPRQDWVVCPYRVFDQQLIDGVAARMFGVGTGGGLATHAAPTLADAAVQAAIKQHLAAGWRVLVYFDAKIGGEISFRATDKSPQMSFDVTFVELLMQGDAVVLGRFGILEIQTMDFHGSYKRAVDKLNMAVHLFPDSFAKEIGKHPEWAGEGIEGPNIANVVKRTFWQMFFKFSFGGTDKCAGTTLAIPASVWDSWQPFLAKPSLAPVSDGTLRLTKPGEVAPVGKIPAWIYVIDADAASPVTPNPIVVRQVIGATADALNHYALVEAPAQASDALLASNGIYATLRRRLRDYWPSESLLPAGESV
jgi:hypothetical protein